MCFYLYSPGHTVCVKYLAEFIFLDKDGSSTVWADLLIENTGGDDLKTIRIVYPNKFYKLSGGEYWTESPVLYSDISTTFINNSEGINWAYELPGSNVLCLPPDETIPSWATRRIVEQPDPLDPTKSIRFEGIIGGENALELEQDDLKYEHLKILHEINFSILRYTFTQPLRGHARWIRLKFRGENAAHNLHKTKHRYLKKITNVLQYQYQIYGPHDAKDRLFTYLLSHKRRCEGNDCSPAIRNSVIELIDFFEREGLRGQTATTTFEKLFIHIDPGDMERITDINSEGSIQIAGFLPNPVASGAETINLYQWKVVNGESGFKFSLLFQAKPLNIFHQVLPWIAFTLAIIGLILRLFPSHPLPTPDSKPPTNEQSVPSEKPPSSPR